MRLILSKDQKDRAGDILAIGWLLYHILDNLPPAEDIHDLKIKELWREYLIQIPEDAIGSNYTRRKMKDSFDFPFEKDYEKLSNTKDL